MISNTDKMTPLYPEKDEELQELAMAVLQQSATLGSRQHPVTLQSLQELLRIINSYYSNLIEGHNTHPHDIVRAMQNEYDIEPTKRNLQLESVAHITVQKEMKKRLQGAPDINIASQEFLCSIHREFYGQLLRNLRLCRTLIRGTKAGLFRASCVKKPLKSVDMYHRKAALSIPSLTDSENFMRRTAIKVLES